MGSHTFLQTFEPYLSTMQLAARSPGAEGRQKKHERQDLRWLPVIHLTLDLPQHTSPDRLLTSSGTHAEGLRHVYDSLFGNHIAESGHDKAQQAQPVS